MVARLRIEIAITQVVLMGSVALVAVSALLGYLIHREWLYAPYVDDLDVSITSMAPTTAACLLMVVIVLGLEIVRRMAERD